MGLITEKVTVKPNGKMIQYYKDLGYEAKYLQELEVNINDLPNNSTAKVQVKCDICGEIKKIKYNEYMKSYKSLGFYTCHKCSWIKNSIIYNSKSEEEKHNIQLKIANTNLHKYGTIAPSQNVEIQEKIRATLLERYNTTNPIHIPGVKEKIEKSNMIKYGAKYGLGSQIIRDKITNTLLDKYGVENVSQIPEVQEKKIANNLLKYGVKNPTQLPEIQEKIHNTMYINGTCQISKQQKYFYDIYKSNYPQSELNYPIGQRFSGDIVIDNLDIEIDYGGHILEIIKGTMIQEEFDQKELIRDKIIKSEGYKVVRIKSYNSRKVPIESKLLEILSYAIDFFNSNPDRSWITFDLDNSCIYNAYYKEPNGLLFDFGELRNIKTA